MHLPLNAIMSNKTANTYPSAIQLAPAKCVLRNCVKAVDTCPFVFDSVPDQYKTQ